VTPSGSIATVCQGSTWALVCKRREMNRAHELQKAQSPSYRKTGRTDISITCSLSLTHRAELVGGSSDNEAATQ
jgi:hypothetical protein